MSAATRFLRYIGHTSILAKQSAKESSHPPYYWHLIIEQIYECGVKSLPLVIITALAIGMIMALQFGITLAPFGGKLYVPKIVSLSIIREFGPVFTSIMIAARMGSGMASEIGSMVVTQQVDAIRALGTSHIKRIVIPRVVGLFISLPILALIANAVGIFGGSMVAMFELGLDPGFIRLKVYETVTLTDFNAGFCKTFFFALYISLTACYYGLTVKGGTKAVGTATNRCVVTCAIGILIGDYLLTKFFWIVETWL